MRTAVAEADIWGGADFAKFDTSKLGESRRARLIGSQGHDFRPAPRELCDRLRTHIQVLGDQRGRRMGDPV